MKGRRKVGTWKGPLNYPMKGDLKLKDARKRRLVDLEGGPPGADRLMAELESRLLQEGRTKKRKNWISTDLERSRISKGVFGTR